MSGGSGSSAWRTVRVNDGSVNAVAATGTETDIVIPASTTDYWIWAACVYQSNYWSIGARTSQIDSVAIDDGGSGWSGFPYLFDGDTNNGLDLYLPVAKVTTSDDTTKSITITQYLNRNFMAFDWPEQWQVRCVTATDIDGGNPNHSFKYDVDLLNFFAFANFVNAIFQMKNVRIHTFQDSNRTYIPFDTAGTILNVAFCTQPYIMHVEEPAMGSVDVLLNPTGNQIIKPFA